MIGLSVTHASGAEMEKNPSAFPPASVVEEINPHDNSVEASFSSTLPIVVIEYADGDALDTDVPALLTVYDGPDGVNTLLHSPTITASVMVQENIGDFSGQGKVSCILSLSAPADPISLAGLPPDHEWQLRGNVHDKGMLRNGVAYALGRILMPDVTPRTQYCEVLTLLNGVYQYEGIHILAESPVRFFQKLTENEKGSVFLRQFVGRGRRGQDIVRGGNMLFSVVATTSLDVISADERRRLGIDLEKLDSVLHSPEPSSFLAYQKLMDEDSLASLFILNLLTLNAYEDRAPYFLMRDGKGKFRFLPDWNFDFALDNSPQRNRPLPFEIEIKPPAPLAVLERRLPVWRTLQEGGRFEDLRIYPNYKALGGDNFPWLDRLLLSRTFLEGLQERYQALTRDELSDANLRALVVSIQTTLGDALERDWLRWQHEYTATEGPFALEPFVRNEITRNRQTWSYDQDLVKITNCLNAQSKVILAQFGHLTWLLPDLYARGKGGPSGAIYSFLSLFAVLLFTHFLTRRR